MMNYGLALSGGGARGAAHVGVLIALEEEHLLPNNISGTSAGGIVAGLYASGILPHEMKEVVLWMEKHGTWYLDPDIKGLLSFLPQIFARKKVRLSGLFKGKRLTNYLCNLTEGIGIETVKHGLLIPAVDLNSGNTIVFTNLLQPDQIQPTTEIEHIIWERNGQLCQIMMASASIPAIFAPKQLESHFLVDGGVTNNLPVDLLIATGIPTVVGVDLGASYETPSNHCIMENVSNSFAIMSRELKDCRSSGEVLLLKPRLPQGAGVLSFPKMEACMEAGYQYTMEQMPKIKRALGG